MDMTPSRGEARRSAPDEPRYEAGAQPIAVRRVASQSAAGVNYAPRRSADARAPLGGVPRRTTRAGGSVNDRSNRTESSDRPGGGTTNAAVPRRPRTPGSVHRPGYLPVRDEPSNDPVDEASNGS